MNYVGRLLGNFKSFYNEINSATLTGAIDVVVVHQQDGTYLCSPFHVRFGKLGVIRSREKLVDIEINGEAVDFRMKLGEAGEAFFVQEIEEQDEVTSELATSPIQSSKNLMSDGLLRMKRASGKHTESDVSSTMSSERVRHDSELSLLSGSSKDVAVQSSKMMTAAPPACDVNITVTDETGGQSRSKDKKKKRHRSGEKKKAGNPHKKVASKHDAETGGQNTSTQDFLEHDGVFDMDNLSEGSLDHELLSPSASISRVVSLPVMEDSKMEMTEEWTNSHYASQCFPFSDGDLTPIVSPTGSRPNTPPAFSDSEVERTRFHAESELPVISHEQDISWDWGKLPETHHKVIGSHEGQASGTQHPLTQAQEKKPSGNLLTFMRQTKKIRHRPEEGGIYLDDLNLDEMDPEIAALYFPKSSQNQICTIKEEDAESGRGSSLPQSPHSVEGAVGSLHACFPYNSDDISLSVCGGLKESEGNVPMEKFMQSLITFDDLCTNTALIDNPDLVVRMGAKFYNWNIAGPIILSLAAFRRPLPEHCVDALVKEHMPKKERKRSGMSSWFSWRRPAAETVDEEKAQVTALGTKSLPVTPVSSPPVTPQKRRDRHQSESSSSDELKADSEKRIRVKKRSHSPKQKVKEIMKKSLRLNSDQIASLNLQPGANEVTFSVTTAYQGTTRCQSHIYLWRHDDKIVISDIDGTITKSDVLGQVLPLVGRDWSQSGVAQLYNKIADNGYQFLYLSARAIGQAGITRDLLRNICQDDLCLPDGPLLLTPSSLINAFHREVIERKPEEFKIGCLRDIAALFPDSRCPFYAGYGNKINDVWAYRAVNIPISRIFSINHKGELRNEQMLDSFTSTYTSLSTICDHFFPPLRTNATGDLLAPGNFHEPAEYSGFTYWKPSLPEVDIAELLTILKTDKK